MTDRRRLLKALIAAPFVIPSYVREANARLRINQLVGFNARPAVAPPPVGMTNAYLFASAQKLERSPAAGRSNTRFTMSWWQKATSITTSHLMVSAGGPLARGEDLFSDSVRNLFWAQSSGNLLVTSGQPVIVNQWQHILLYSDQTAATAVDRATMICDGVVHSAWQVDNRATMTPWVEWTGTDPFKYGLWWDDTFGWTGLMADMIYLDNVLEPLSSFYNAGNWVDYAGSFGTHDWRLDGREATVGHDSSGNNNDFTSTGVVYQTGDLPPGA